MQQAKLYPLCSKLCKYVQHASVVASTPAAAPGDDAWVFDHHVLEIRRSDPHALPGVEDGAHHLIVVFAVGNDAQRHGSISMVLHPDEDTSAGMPFRKRSPRNELSAQCDPNTAAKITG